MRLGRGSRLGPTIRLGPRIRWGPGIRWDRLLIYINICVFPIGYSPSAIEYPSSSGQGGLRREASCRGAQGGVRVARALALAREQPMGNSKSNSSILIRNDLGQQSFFLYVLCYVYQFLLFALDSELRCDSKCTIFCCKFVC